MNDPTVPQPGELQQAGDGQADTHLGADLHEVAPEPFWRAEQVRGGNGYDAMEIARPHGWHPIPSWGEDGWDLGSWPLVIVFWRVVQKPGDPKGRTRTFELAEYVEGDVKCWKLPSKEALDEQTARIAFAHWKFGDDEWARPYATFEELPDRFKRKPEPWL